MQPHTLPMRAECACVDCSINGEWIFCYTPRLPAHALTPTATMLAGVAVAAFPN